jgi:glycine cleavage system H protein
MSEVKQDLKYTKDHEWISIDGDIGVIGITDHAQSELGDIVFIELPEVCDEFTEDDSMGTIEAVKTVADIYSPFDCVVTEINTELEDNADNVNTSPYEDGWIMKVKILNESTLLTSEEYSELIK